MVLRLSEPSEDGWAVTIAPGGSPPTPQTDADIFIFTMDRNKDIKPWELDYRLKQSSKSTKVTD